LSRFTHSSRRTPCPVCGRSKDADCRWIPGEVIYCHQGSSNQSSGLLKPGDVVTINGFPWALVARDGGFAGAANVFRPDRSDQDFQPRRVTPKPPVIRGSDDDWWEQPSRRYQPTDPIVASLFRRHQQGGGL
jgi:hypothetical protein